MGDREGAKVVAQAQSAAFGPKGKQSEDGLDGQAFLIVRSCRNYRFFSLTKHF